MTADFPILLDACVLANFGVCDLFLRLAETPRLLVPRWSREILNEVQRTQLEKLRPPWPEHLVQLWQKEVSTAFPDACVTGYESLIPFLTNDDGDRHVLAAAIKAGVSLIVTFNQRHFPEKALAPWGVKAVHPQDYLMTLYSMSPAVVMGKLAAISKDKGTDLEEVIIHLGKSLPCFASEVLTDIGHLGS